MNPFFILQIITNNTGNSHFFPVFICYIVPMKILLVEDEIDLSEVINQSLSKEGYKVETANTYITALDKVMSYEYDCIILDIMLPGGSGLNILKELKSAG